MTYRDDHDAALARADALQREVDELKRERDQRAAPPPPAPPAPPPQPTPAPAPRLDRGRSVMSIGVIAAVLIVGSVIAVVRYQAKQARIAARQAADDKRVHDALVAARTLALGHLEPCIEAVAWDEEEQRVSAAAHPMAEELYGTSRLGVTCLEVIDGLVRDPEYVTPAGAAALAELRAAENSFKGTLRDRARFDAAIARRHAAIREVRAKVLPQLRGTIEKLLDLRERAHGRDAAWWRVALPLREWQVMELALEASKLEAGGAVDLAAASSAIHDALNGLKTQVDRAPDDVQRRFKHEDYFTRPVFAGEPLPISAVSLFINNELTIAPDALVALH